MSQSQRKARRVSRKVANEGLDTSTPTFPQLSINVLGLIFEYAKPDKDEATTDLKAASRFPHNLAAVCKKWREVLSLTAGYWTTPIFYVDSTHPTPLGDVKSFLEWSKNLMITVEVKRSTDAEAIESDPQEGERTRKVIDILKPHVHRCMLITFDLIHGSSLPSVSRDLFNISHYLMGLFLRCKTDGRSPGQPQLMTIDPVHKVASQPNLIQLILSGHTIYDVLQNSQDIFKCLTKAQALVFCCLDSAKHSETQTVTVTDLFRAFGYPEALGLGALYDLNIQYVPRLTGATRVTPKANRMLLSGLGNTSMRTVFEHLDFHAVKILSIEHCSFADLSIKGPRQLFLRGITEDLLKPLSNWKGNIVHFKDCPTVNDSLLDLFSGQGAPGTVQGIFLENCPNISVNGLQRLCMMRRRPGFLPIMSLCVSGSAPEICEEDMQYLASLVGEDLTTQTGFFEWKLEIPESFEDSLRPR